MNFELFFASQIVVNLTLFLSLLFIPFKLCQFLAHFGAFKDLKVTLNVWMRMTPGFLMSYFIFFVAFLPFYCLAQFIAIGGR